MNAPSILKELYRRYAEENLEAVVELCDDRFCYSIMPENNDAVSYTGVYRGVEALLARQRKTLAEFTYDRFEIVDIFGTDHKAAARVAVKLTSKVTGASFEGELCHIVTVRHGKVQEIHEFFDTEQMARVAQPPEPRPER